MNEYPPADPVLLPVGKRAARGPCACRHLVPPRMRLRGSGWLRPAERTGGCQRSSPVARPPLHRPAVGVRPATHFATGLAETPSATRQPIAAGRNRMSSAGNGYVLVHGALRERVSWIMIERVYVVRACPARANGQVLPGGKPSASCRIFTTDDSDGYG